MSAKHTSLIIGSAIVVLASCLHPALAQSANTAVTRSIERGRYLVKITGCNDCHTPGYAMSDGNVPEKQWLTGDQLGWRGRP